ncbi:MAG: ExbD/TolR family protein [Vicinamibacterales bacterium]
MPKLQAIDSGHQGRGRRGARVSTSLSEINVVPLVDVMLVLLIIFMVAAPMMQRGLDVNLPVARRAPQMTDQRVFVTVPLTFAKDRQVQIDDERIRLDVLSERVRQIMLGKDDKEVFLRGDGGVTLQQLMEVMDRLREGGVEKVGIVSRLPGER